MNFTWPSLPSREQTLQTKDGVQAYLAAKWDTVNKTLLYCGVALLIVGALTATCGRAFIARQQARDIVEMQEPAPPKPKQKAKRISPQPVAKPRKIRPQPEQRELIWPGDTYGNGRGRS